MIQSFQSFSESLKQGTIKINNKQFNMILKNYSFCYISQTLDYSNKYQQIEESIKETKIIIIDQFIGDDHNDIFFIIGLNKMIILIIQSKLTIIEKLFTEHPELSIYFLSNSKENFNSIIKIKNSQFGCKLKFFEEISNFRNQLSIISKDKQIKKIWNVIQPCLFGYLIKQGYEKAKEKQKSIFSTRKIFNPQDQYMNKNEYIFLRNLGLGSSSKVELIYHIEKGELFAYKKSFHETIKLIEREKNNYLNMSFPLLPEFYGIITENDSINLIIQFIYGKTLLNIFKKGKKIHLDKDEKIIIIFEIMMVINYLHLNNFVYRDLKPNNIIIDENKNAFIIDFDRMVKYNSEVHTFDFSSTFVDPKINSGNVSFKNDIFSIGQIIYYIMKEEISNQTIDSQILKIYEKCTKNNLEERYDILSLMIDFYLLFPSQIKSSQIKNEPVVNFIQGFIYCEPKYNQQNINKSIYYFTLAANQNHSKAQFNLGVIYLNGINVPIDIEKAFHYFTLAADLNNNSDAQVNIGVFYLEGKLVKKNLNKAIEYFTLSANQGNALAQFNLGLLYFNENDIDKSLFYYSLAADQNYYKAQCNIAIIYYEGKYIKRDIKKAIYYFTLAANQNESISQYFLGRIYYEENNIEKAIHYLTLAANQNNQDAQLQLMEIYSENDDTMELYCYYLVHYFSKNLSEAQYRLGIIYCEDGFLKRDINKAIYYFTLAAKSNYSKAQYNLGLIFYEGKYVPRDINRAMYNFSLASNQNLPEAQHNLGLIYYENKYVKMDINKAIYYFTLASENNYSCSQFYLGLIYETGEFIQRDINKAIKYYTLAANNNDANAQCNLAMIYEGDVDIKPDINKSIYYYTLSANQDSTSQYILGCFYLSGQYVTKNINKALNYLNLASINGYIDAHFALGYLYHSGKYIKRNISKSIHYYKEASSFYNQYAKNNLGIIYKNGFGNEIPKNIQFAIIYFREAIQQNKDELSMYNLAHIYIYEDQTKEKNDESIKLLIDALYNFFYPSYYLLCIALIKKHGFNLKNIQNDLLAHTDPKCNISSNVIKFIQYYNLFNKSSFENVYHYYKNFDYIYKYNKKAKLTKDLFTIPQQQLNMNLRNITSDFYEGFGI